MAKVHLGLPDPSPALCWPRMGGLGGPGRPKTDGPRIGEIGMPRIGGPSRPKN